MSEKNHWNRCDVCGRFISYADFSHGAVRELVYPDSYFTKETWETLCKNHVDKSGEAQWVKIAIQSRKSPSY